MKLLVIVIASKGHPYDKFLELWRSRTYPDWVMVKYVFLNPVQEENIEETGDTLSVKGEESMIPGIFIKTRVAMWWYMYMKKLEFTHILRTNLSSYFRFDGFAPFLQTIPIFRGVGAYSEEGSTLLSGAGYCISRDLILPFLEWSREEHEVGKMVHDDVEFSMFIKELGVPVQKWLLTPYRPGIPVDTMTGFHLRFRTRELRDGLEHRLDDIKGYEEALAIFR